MGRLVAVNESGLRVGESHPRARLSDAQVDEMRTLHEEKGRSYAWIAMRMKIPVATAKKICRYERRNQIMVKWVFR